MNKRAQQQTERKRDQYGNLPCQCECHVQRHRQAMTDTFLYKRMCRGNRKNNEQEVLTSTSAELILKRRLPGLDQACPKKHLNPSRQPSRVQDVHHRLQKVQRLGHVSCFPWHVFSTSHNRIVARRIMFGSMTDHEINVLTCSATSSLFLFCTVLAQHQRRRIHSRVRQLKTDRNKKTVQAQFALSARRVRGSARTSHASSPYGCRCLIPLEGC